MVPFASLREKLLILFVQSSTRTWRFHWTLGKASEDLLCSCLFEDQLSLLLLLFPEARNDLQSVFWWHPLQIIRYHVSWPRTFGAGQSLTVIRGWRFAAPKVQRRSRHHEASIDQCQYFGMLGSSRPGIACLARRNKLCHCCEERWHNQAEVFHYQHGLCTRDSILIFLTFSQFGPEGEAWYGIPDFDLLANNITVPGLSPLYPQAHW